jgi:hypothetical protein
MPWPGSSATEQRYGPEHIAAWVLWFSTPVRSPSDRVRLYIISQRRMAKFASDIVREGVAGAPGDSEGADAYFDMRGRFTHCYGCKRDLNSIDFSLCDLCRWIRCECGACGCNYQRFGEGSAITN